MTKKEFAEKYNRGMCFDEEFTSDLNALLREELIKFHLWLEGSSQCLGVVEDEKYSTDVVDEYLKSQQ